MIIVRLVGGLGNQMFQYATARALAAQRRTELKLDLSSYGEQQRDPHLRGFSRSVHLFEFNITGTAATSEEVRRVRDRYRRNRASRAVAGFIRRRFRSCPLGHFDEQTLNFDPAVRRLSGNVYLEGFFQCEQYFADHANIVRDEFSFRDNALYSYARDFIESRRRPGSNVVAVHVRRGDLAYSVEVLKNPNAVHGPPVTPEYISEAMRQFDGEDVFIVFSDSDKDLNWCRDHIKARNIHYCYGHTAMQDFAVMQACDHQIISNSTFSWWAAWLNSNARKAVVAPKAWFHPGFAPGHRMESLIPSTWKLI